MRCMLGVVNAVRSGSAGFGLRIHTMEENVYNGHNGNKVKELFIWERYLFKTNIQAIKPEQQVISVLCTKLRDQIIFIWAIFMFWIRWKLLTHESSESI